MDIWALIGVTFLILVIIFIILLLGFIYVLKDWIQYKTEVIRAYMNYEYFCQKKELRSSATKMLHKYDFSFKDNFSNGLYVRHADNLEKICNYMFNYPEYFATHLSCHECSIGLENRIFYLPEQSGCYFRKIYSHRIENNKRLKPFLNFAKEIILYECTYDFFYGNLSCGRSKIMYHMGKWKYRKLLFLTKINILLDFINWNFTENYIFLQKLLNTLGHGNKRQTKNVSRNERY